jgi:chemotaxis protein MotA
MIGVIGIAVIFSMVFGGYLLAGGKMSIILHSLPFEMMMIGGAAVGTFMISNDLDAIKHTGKDLVKVFRGPVWKREDYRDLLCLLFSLIRVSRKNPVELEAHIENPDESQIFSRYPKIAKDTEAIALICDTLRAGSLNYDDPHQVEEVLGKRLDKRSHEVMHSSHSLQTIADSLPALGIVAAVLGVIKTMASIDKPPEVLGGLIGGALVGTFLGVFLAYGIVAPFASRIKDIEEKDSSFYEMIKEVLIADLFRHAPNLCIEVGRQNIPKAMRPAFDEIEEFINDLKRSVE